MIYIVILTFCTPAACQHVTFGPFETEELCENFGTFVVENSEQEDEFACYGFLDQSET